MPCIEWTVASLICGLSETPGSGFEKGPAEADPFSFTCVCRRLASADTGNERCDDERYDGHQLDENVHRRA